MARSLTRETAQGQLGRIRKTRTSSFNPDVKGPENWATFTSGLGGDARLPIHSVDSRDAHVLTIRARFRNRVASAAWVLPIAETRWDMSK
jgi:hypothetical protein